MRVLPLTVAGLTLLTAACGLAKGGGGSAATPGGGTGTAAQALTALVPLQGCDEIETYIRSRYLAEMNRRLDKLVDDVRTNGGSCSMGEADSFAGASASAGTSSSGSSASSSSSSGGTSGGVSASPARASSTSTTNNQVAGVDEADFVKNDDKYLYIAADGAFQIIEAWPAATAHEVARLPLPGKVEDVFVEGDRAVVYVAIPQDSPNATAGDYVYGSSSTCTYGYDCVPGGDGTKTEVLVYDISDRTAPKQVRMLDLG